MLTFSPFAKCKSQTANSKQIEREYLINKAHLITHRKLKTQTSVTKLSTQSLGMDLSIQLILFLVALVYGDPVVATLTLDVERLLPQLTSQGLSGYGTIEVHIRASDFKPKEKYSHMSYQLHLHQHHSVPLLLDLDHQQQLHGVQ
ncbi:hypothetical protein EB796_003390 [Bugula neritina]|uniref:Uncharacterized protein n=1 Tax=Bugula neritina TaxID=10212 RepID=A0A7J7KHY5_BUGNE|nr:hypothetical protein EB796_003390 [Bugula neritina]